MAKNAESGALAINALNEPPPASLFRNPIDYIFADHFRQRALCKILDEIAGDQTANTEKITAALQFLRTDYEPHLIDEEEDLFPLLRKRAAPEDRIEEVLGLLSQEHAEGEKDAEAIIEELAAVLATGGEYPGGKAFRDLLKRFAANERRHLTLENAIVLPLARVRLKADDLRNLGKRMAARRGVDVPEDGANTV